MPVNSTRTSRMNRNRARYASLVDQLEPRTLMAATPLGVVQTFTAASITGYVYDVDTPNTPVHVQVVVDGAVVAEGDANIDRPDIANRTQGTGTAHGFSFPLTLPAGTHNVQVIALDTETEGVTKTLRTGKITNKPPKAAISSATNLQVVGFVSDPDNKTAPLTVEIHVDGELKTTVTADQARPTGARGAGSSNNWFVANLSGLSDGPHLIEVFATDISSGALVKVAERTTPNQKPVGKLNVVNSSTISGYAMDPDSTAGVTVILQVGKDRFPLGAASGDDPTAPGHGFSTATPTHFAGTHTVKLIALDTFSGTETVVATGKFTNRPPKGALESATPTLVTGYAFDPDFPTTPLQIVVRIDFNKKVPNSGTNLGPFVANLPRPDLVTKRKIANPEHGFGVALNGLTVGTHKIDILAADAVTGVTTLIGTRTVVVRA